MIAANITSYEARALFEIAFEQADALANKNGSLVELAQAYEKASLYFQKISDLVPEYDQEIITHHLDCLEELIENYEEIVKKQTINNKAAAATESQGKKDCCLMKYQQTFNLLIGTEAETQDRVDFLNYHTEMITTARKWGFICQSTPKDGSCLFHAIAHQLKIHNIPVNVKSNVVLHVLLRSIAVAHLKANAPYYQEKLSGITVEQYADRVSKADEWGDHFEIAALVRELNITLIVIQNNDVIHIFKTNNAKPIVCLGYEKGASHYVSLQQADHVRPNINLLQQVEKADFVESIRLTLPVITAATQIPTIRPTKVKTPTLATIHKTTSPPLIKPFTLFSILSSFNFFKKAQVEEDKIKLISHRNRKK